MQRFSLKRLTLLKSLKSKARTQLTTQTKRMPKKEKTEKTMQTKRPKSSPFSTRHLDLKTVLLHPIWKKSSTA
jgi:hypothetical protein